LSLGDVLLAGLEHFGNVNLKLIVRQAKIEENSRNYPFNKGREFSMTYRNPQGEQPASDPLNENEMGKSSGAAITPAMVEAASDVLRESGLLEYFSEGPTQVIVRKMLEAALAMAPSDAQEGSITREMAEAGVVAYDQFQESYDSWTLVHAIYRAMIVAQPSRQPAG
jgi:hypothetical protein